MNQSTEELIERLGYHRECEMTGDMILSNPLGPQAAQAITDLQAENERLRDIMQRYMDCDGSNGIYDASKYYEIKEEARAALKGE